MVQWIKRTEREVIHVREVISLNGGWQFFAQPERFEPPFAAPGPEGLPVTLPHSWNAEDGQSGNGYARQCCCYQRPLTLPAGGECFYLEFQGANSVCRAWLDETFLGEHRGGYSAFRFDITGLCRPGGQALLTVFVDNRETADVSPLAGDFTIFGGLYRDVNLICVPQAHFDLLYWGTAGVLLTPAVDPDGAARLAVETHLVRGENARVRYTVTGPDGQTAAAAEADGAAPSAVLPIEAPALWQGKADPALYTCTAQLLDKTGVLDEVSLHFGLRAVKVDPDAGFFLNGESMPLRGVARHQDRCGCGNAVTPAQMDEDFAFLRELGANAVRLSHYQHAQHFYDLCDREGLVVWAEIPMLAMEENPGLLENAEQQLTELILQNRHHPSICFWGLQNEIAIAGETLAMYRGVERLQQLARRLDPTRLTTGANLYCVKNSSPLNRITDVVAYNVYYGWYYGTMPEYAGFLDSFHAENPDVCLGVSEYGVDCNPAFHSDTPKVKDYSEEFQSLFHETVYPLLDSRRFVWGTFVWNLFDFGSAMRNEGGTKGRNCKGLVTYDRQTRKDAFYYYKACWSAEPFVHIASRRFRRRAAQAIAVKVYSNQPSVALEVNGRPFAVRSGRTVFTFENVPLQPGENTVTARAGASADTVVWERVDRPEQSYIYVDPNPGYNVKNWFTLGQTEEDLFPADRYSLMDTMADLTAQPQCMERILEYLPALGKDERLRKASSFTLFKIVNRMSGSFDEKRVQELNRRLNKIPKQKLP